jgi:hypothetical protein
MDPQKMDKHGSTWAMLERKTIWGKENMFVPVPCEILEG